MDANIIKSPWDSETVDRLNEWQQSGLVHPYTCGKRRTDEHHLDGEGVLKATTDGWVCPFCDYTQDWAILPSRKALDELKQMAVRLTAPASRA